MIRQIDAKTGKARQNAETKLTRCFNRLSVTVYLNCQGRETMCQTMSNDSKQCQMMSERSALIVSAYRHRIFELSIDRVWLNEMDIMTTVSYFS